jgi:hypothetical protein
MQNQAGKKPLKRHVMNEERRKTAVGFYRFFYAMHLMLEAASSQSKHALTRYETLLLSIFRNGIVSRKGVEEEFRNLLLMLPESVAAAKGITDAFNGLVKKGLIKPIKRSVQLTRQGRAELRRMSEIVDTVYDQLIETLPSRDQKKLVPLMRRIGQTRSPD